MLKNKKAFTLAELMLVFTVIGILTAILVPGLFLASPDQDVLKAKKAYNTVTRAVQTLMNSDPYVETGSLNASHYITGTGSDDIVQRNAFFCTNLANAINARNVNCTSDKVNEYMPNDPGGSDPTQNCSNSFNPADNTNSEHWSGVRKGICARLANNEAMGPNVRSGVEVLVNKRINYSDDDNGLEPSLDHACDNYFDSMVSNHEENEYNFRTPDNTVWGIQLINYAHPWVLNMNGVRIPSLHGVICFSTDSFKDKNHMFSVGVRHDGVVHPGAKLARLLEDEEE